MLREAGLWRLMRGYDLEFWGIIGVIVEHSIGLVKGYGLSSSFVLFSSRGNTVLAIVN